MTVETTTRKENFSGGQQNLTFSFRALTSSPSDIKLLVSTSGTETVLTYGVDYTVTISTDGIGGTVRVNPTYSTAYTYTVYREVTKTQESDYDDYNQFPADTLETNLDKITMLLQETDEDIDRAIKIPISSTLTGSALQVTVSGGTVVGFNAAGTGLTTYQNAANSLTEAAKYASTASTQASLAGNYATSASTSATAAATSATLAGNYATSLATLTLQSAFNNGQTIGVTSSSLQVTSSTTRSTVSLVANGSGPHLLMTGDPTVASPIDGSLWFTGSALNFRNGTSTVDLLASSNVKVGTFSFDLATTSSTQAITGVGFQPKMVFLVGNVSTTPVTSLGFSDGSSQGCLMNYHLEVANGWGRNNSALFFVGGTSAYQEADVLTFGTDGFTITWTKSGTPTGSATCYYLAMR